MGNSDLSNSGAAFKPCLRPLTALPRPELALAALPGARSSPGVFSLTKKTCLPKPHVEGLEFERVLRSWKYGVVLKGSDTDVKAVSQRVHLDFEYGARGQKPYHTCVWGFHSILAL